MTINYSGGIHDVFIIKDGKRFDRESHPYIFNSIESVEVSIVGDGLASGKIHFTPSYNDAIRILREGILGLGVSRKGQHPEDTGGSSVSVEASTIGSKTASPSNAQASDKNGSPILTTIVSVRFLYPDQTEFGSAEAATPWFSMMLGAPDLQISGTDISFTMNCHSSGIIAKSVMYQMSYNGQSLYKVIEELAKTIGFEIVFDEDDTATLDTLNKRTVNGAYTLSPFNLIRKLLKETDCYFYFFSGTESSPKDKILIKSRESVQASKADYTFVVFKQISPRDRIIPVYDIQLESNGSMFVKGSTFGSEQEGIRSDTKEGFTVTSDTKSDKAARTGGATGTGSGALPLANESGAGTSPGLAPAPANTKRMGSHTPTIRSGNVSNEDEIKSDTLQRGTVGNKYRITCPGLPGLYPMRIVRVEFADIPELTGMGTVMQVTHKTGAGGWETELEFNQSSSVLANGAKTTQTAVANKSSNNEKKAILIGT